MRKKFFIIFIPGIIIGVIFALVVSAIYQASAAPDADLLQPVKKEKTSGADKYIDAAQSAIRSNPKNAKGYNQLASAFMQKARETGDFSLNTRAEKSLEKSLELSPDNYEAIKLKSALELTFHRFADALQTARKGQNINPRDHEIYGTLVDANVELGDYQSAVDAAQKMVDLRPDTASYSRISYLRSLHGDRNGAIEAMKMAIEASSPRNPESKVWCVVHLGDELMNNSQLAEAEQQYDYALHIFPDYHLALAAKARARYAAGDAENAIAFFKRAIERVPAPDYVASLGDIYAVTGRSEEAKQQYEQVEFIEKSNDMGGTYSRQLALFWADHDLKLDEALAAAQKEYTVRKDIYAADLLAWTLFKKGRFAEAKTSMDEAMKLGTQDPKLLYHAGLIESANGNDQKAAEHLQKALQINPFFDVLQAPKAKEKLAALRGK